MRIAFTSVLSFCLLCASVFGASDEFKQLAGDASEIAAMRLPAPETLGISSKAAVIPITGETLEIPVENSGKFKLLIIAPDSRSWKISAALPGENAFSDLRAGVFTFGLNRFEGEYGLDGNKFPAEVFEFEQMRGGTLRIKIENAKTLAKRDGKPLGFIVAASDSNYRLRSFVNTNETVTGRETGFVASLIDAADATQFGVRDIQATLQTPSGKTLGINFKNNGDGTFGGTFVPQLAGKYTAQLVARGTTPEGGEFIRTTEHVFNVGTPARIGGRATARIVDGLRFRVALPVENLKPNQRVIAHAEIWGENAAGEASAVAWIGGMTVAERGRRGDTVSLALDSRWLARNSQAVHELRNVRLQDADSSVVIGTADRVALPALDLPELSRNYNREITDEMRTGKRPQTVTTNAPGGKLMLVHGYCSGSNPWNPAQFASSVQFLDANANRSHDQFAQRIRNYGAQFPSFGIVAHSQGGAAALHLYTYYWSGLDSATGARLIQSVGTPYQGTALAGNLALIGSIFGAGCGSNTDLTYSGAAAWLAGVPSWARAKVFYHTTSFADVWWRYDYCNIASDVVLSDPDDGVVERAYAQLPGANNLGHKTGWCHTSGMRDPAQTSDSARNSVMNANAAR